jgi:hypothetical protein
MRRAITNGTWRAFVLVIAMTVRLRSCLFVGLFGALVACSKKAPEPTPVAQSTTPAPAPSKEEVGGDGKLDPKDPNHGKRKLMGLDVGVFADGAQIGVLRFGELPQIPAIELEGGAKAYRIYDYLKAIGLSPESLKSVHFHGNGDRIASIEGSELRKEKDRFVFRFLSGETGTPLQKWDTGGLKNEFVIHEIRRVTIYVKKAAPKLHETKQCHLGADGDCIEGVPYSNGEIAKGTRVYVDGKMVGFVKRRQVGEALAAGDTPEGEHKFSVAKLVASMGADPSGIKSVELVAGDDVVARANGEQFNKLASSVTFTLPKHNHGKVRVHVPAEMQARKESDKDALVSAVLLYKSTTPTNRELVTISDDTDLNVQLAAIDDARGKIGRGE